MSDETYESVEKNLGTSEVGVYSKKTYGKLLKVIKDNQERDIIYSPDENQMLVEKLIEKGGSHRVSTWQGFLIL